jgi:hypothetical protein
MIVSKMPKDCERSAPPISSGGWLLLVAMVLLVGLLIFAHGCHGDEDHELFAQGDPTFFSPGGAAE